MQHEDSSRTELVERRKRQREAHLTWRALTFPARPPPPHVEPAMKSKWMMPCGASASLVARIRRQPFAQDPSPSLPSLPDATEEVNPSPTLSTPPAPTRQEALEHRLQTEWRQRNPLTDTKCTTAPSCTVAVLCLSEEVTEDDLRRFGERFGRVVAVRVVRHHATGASRKYGFVQYSYNREMLKAVRDCSDPTLPRPRIRGKIVVVEMERGRLDPSYVPSRFRPLQSQGRTALVASMSASSDANANLHAGRPTDSTALESPPPSTAADAILDNLDDYLADLM